MTQTGSICCLQCRARARAERELGRLVYFAATCQSRAELERSFGAPQYALADKGELRYRSDSLNRKREPLSYFAMCFDLLALWSSFGLLRSSLFVRQPSFWRTQGGS
jgi:hypothetical protein